MSLLHVFILSVVEGITEFLPISSTGHLILVSKILGIAGHDFTKTFEIAIQLGAIMAVVVLYFKRFLKDIDMYKKLFVAFIPTAIVGFFLYPFIKSFLLSSSVVTLNALFWGGIVLIIVELLLKKKKKKETVGTQITYTQSFLIGVFQSISVIPGVSRAASTIIGGLVTGLTRQKAVEFSFLLAVPTMFAATSLDIYKSLSYLNSGNIPSLLIGFLVSFIFALIAIKFLIGFVKKNSFISFGVYRIILAILFWIFVN